MAKCFFLTVIISVIWDYSFSQVRDEHINKNKTTIIDQQTNPGGVLDEIKLPAPAKIGSYFIFDEYYMGNIYLNKFKPLLGVKVRINLETDELEIIYKDDELKAIPEFRINNFVLFNSFSDTLFFENVSHHKPYSNTNFKGFFQILFSDKVKLLKKYELKIIKANYSIHFDAGNRDDRYVKNEVYYILIEKKLIPLQNTKRKNIKMFKEYNNVLNLLDLYDFDFKLEQSLIHFAQLVNESF